MHSPSEMSTIWPDSGPSCRFFGGKSTLGKLKFLHLCLRSFFVVRTITACSENLEDLKRCRSSIQNQKCRVSGSLCYRKESTMTHTAGSDNVMMQAWQRTWVRVPIMLIAKRTRISALTICIPYKVQTRWCLPSWWVRTLSLGAWCSR